MLSTLLFILFGLVAAIVFLNIYFRVKIIKSYRYLTLNRVEFGNRHIFNPQLLEQEIIPKYPDHAFHIRRFTKNIRFSFIIAALLILCISIFGAIVNLAP